MAVAVRNRGMAPGAGAGRAGAPTPGGPRPAISRPRDGSAGGRARAGARVAARRAAAGADPSTRVLPGAGSARAARATAARGPRRARAASAHRGPAVAPALSSPRSVPRAAPAVLALAAAVLVAGLGLLGDVARAQRVPSTSGLVRVHQGESLWQLARRVAPSADPGAVAARVVELNDLPSSSVYPGEALLSPVG